VSRGRAGWMRVAGRAVAVVGVVLAVLAVRVVTASESELQHARVLHDRGDIDAAIVHYRRAARWYAPGNPWGTEALAALETLGDEAERTGESERALAAFRAIRAAIMGSRSFYIPYPDRLERANGRIADLMAAGPTPPIDAGRSRAELRADHLRLLRSAGARPRVLWTVVLLVGFASWVGGAFAFAARAIDDEDRLLGPQARVWGTCVLVGFGLWILGMALA